MLRCVQCGISISDLELLSIGMVNDMFIEMKNDEYEYPVVATQEDIDRLEEVEIGQNESKVLRSN